MSDTPAPTPEPTGGIGSAIVGLGKATAQSAMTAAMTAGMLLGGSQLVTPQPSPDEPAPVVTDFGEQVREAFVAEGGTKDDALKRGAAWWGFGRIIERDRDFPGGPRLTTGREVAERAGDTQWYCEIPAGGFDRTWGLVSAALNQHVGGGPLDETRRAKAAAIYQEAGEALLEYGGE